MSSRCILDNQHGVVMSDADYALYEIALAACQGRNNWKQMNAQQQECELVLEYARLKTKQRKEGDKPNE